jgi:hypothetical protein
MTSRKFLSRVSAQVAVAAIQAPLLLVLVVVAAEDLVLALFFFSAPLHREKVWWLP